LIERSFSVRCRHCRLHSVLAAWRDPVKASRVIIETVEAADPPLNLPLGKNARERIEAKFESFRREIDAWREKIDGTDFDAS